jgi:hypothetical protein
VVRFPVDLPTGIQDSSLEQQTFPVLTVSAAREGDGRSFTVATLNEAQPVFFVHHSRD